MSKQLINAFEGVFWRIHVQLFEERQTIFVITDDGEIGFQPQMAAMLAQQVGAERMKGADVNTAIVLSQ